MYRTYEVLVEASDVIQVDAETEEEAKAEAQEIFFNAGRFDCHLDATVLHEGEAEVE